MKHLTLHGSIGQCAIFIPIIVLGETYAKQNIFQTLSITIYCTKGLDDIRPKITFGTMFDFHPYANP